MIDPVIFSFKLFNFEVALRWYGVLVMVGVVVGALWTEREIRRRGENGEIVWDAMIWLLPAGIIGARLWYVVNSTLGGNTSYIENPIRILNIPEGGLHFFGGLLFGALGLFFFLKRRGKDGWLFLDAVAPATLLGQAIGRPANFINQELYGQPTHLPWGIPIEASHRLPQYSDLSLYPVETTRFHPTFAYEMILNFLIFLFLWQLSRRYEDKMKPGAIFSAWLLLAGLSRAFIEFFRPDQPRIGDTFLSYTMAVSFLMAVSGAVMLLVRFGKLRLAFAEGWEEQYRITIVETKPHAPSETGAARAVVTEVEPAPNPVKTRAPARSKTAGKKSPAKKTTTKKTPAKRRVSR